MSELENNYKKAFIKYVNVRLPEQIKAMNAHTEAMKDLARQIRLMPRSVRMRP